MADSKFAFNPSTPSMVLLGMSGAGKTTLLQRMSGDNRTFRVRRGFLSDTECWQLAELQLMGRTWIVVDGPGPDHYTGSAGSSSQADAEHMREMIRKIKLLTQIKGILLVVNSNHPRFTPSMSQAIMTYRDVFVDPPRVTVEALARRMAVVFTNHLFGNTQREERLRKDFLPLVEKALGARPCNVFFVQLNPEDPEVAGGILTDQQKQQQEFHTRQSLERMLTVLESFDGISLEHLSAERPIGQEEAQIALVSQITSNYENNLAAARHHHKAVWNPYPLMMVQPCPEALQAAAVTLPTAQLLLAQQLVSTYQAAVDAQRNAYQAARLANVRKFDFHAPGEWTVFCRFCSFEYNHKRMSGDENKGKQQSHYLNDCPQFPMRKWQDEPDPEQQRELHLQTFQTPEGQKQKRAVLHQVGSFALKIAGQYAMHTLGQLNAQADGSRSEWTDTQDGLA